MYEQTNGRSNMRWDRLMNEQKKGINERTNEAMNEASKE